MSLDGCRILIADDDATIRRMLSRALREWGYHVSLAVDGAAALAELASDCPPAIAILDLHMPGLTGHEVCRRVRDLALTTESFMMLLTAYGTPDGVIEALNSGFDDVLEKPLKLKELRARLEAIVRSRRRQAVMPMRPKTLYPEGMRAPIEGRTIGASFVVEKLLGEGGMGTVWRGRHVLDGTPVAIKLIRPKLVTDDVALSRFRVEAMVGMRLRSVHATRVFDFGITPDKLPYLVMEYLEGESLLEHVNRCGALTLEATGVLVSQIASALSAAEALGIAHRDVKPENILLTKSAVSADAAFPYTAKLIDFGIAKIRTRQDFYAQSTQDAFGSMGSSQPLTAHGCLVGTPHYMSPEQLLGLAGADARADLWGLAASAFFAVTGDTPFDGATLGQVVMRVCSEPLPRMAAALGGRAAAHAFDAWFETACSRDASLRYPTPDALAAALVVAGRDGSVAFAKSGTFSLVPCREGEARPVARAR